MTGGFFTTSSRLALMLAAGLVAGSLSVANAADTAVGGDCCADLEERIAELEATTVRKGNRKISLTLSGRVHEAVMYWNDGVNDDIYVVEPDITRNRFGFAGRGKVDSNLEIGYNLVVRASIGRQRAQQQNFVAPTSDFEIETETVFLQDKRYGRLEWGFRSSAFRDLVDGGFDLGGATTVMAKSGISEWVSNFNIGNTTWSNVLTNFQVGRIMQVRYDTPAIQGFVLSASWGDDDKVSANISYDNKFGDTQVRLGAGYYVDTNGTAFPTGEDFERVMWSLGGSVYNAPSGLFLTALYIHRDAEPITALVTPDDSTAWWVKGGWRNKVNAYGQTGIYLEYGKSENVRIGNGTAARGGAANLGLGVGGEMFGVGITQDIDPVGASAYLSYRKHRLNDTDIGTGIVGCGPAASPTTLCDDLDVVMGGMIVNF